MAYEAMSPFGISWGYLALLLLPVLLAASMALVAVRRRDTTPRLWLLLIIATAAGVWTFVTVGASVMVPSTQDPQGSECVVNPFGDNPDRVVSWESDCGKALARHMVTSAGPTLTMLAVTLATTVQGLRRRDRAVL